MQYAFIGLSRNDERSQNRNFTAKQYEIIKKHKSIIASFTNIEKYGEKKAKEISQKISNGLTGIKRSDETKIKNKLRKLGKDYISIETRKILTENLKNMIWMTHNETNETKRINKDEINDYLESNWKIGREFNNAMKNPEVSKKFGDSLCGRYIITLSCGKRTYQYPIGHPRYKSI